MILYYTDKNGGMSYMVTEIAVFTALEGKEEELGQAIVRGMNVIR